MKSIFLLAAFEAITIVALPASAAAAREPDLPPGISCSQVRELVKEHGYLRSIAWAIRQGYSAYQIREAKKCLR